MKKNNYWLGIILIAFGSYLFLSRFFSFSFSFSKLLPILYLGGGLYFELKYFKTRTGNENLVLGGLLLTMGVINIISRFSFNMYISHVRSLALGIAIGIFQIYWFDRREPYILIISIVIFIFSIFHYISRYFNWIDLDLVFPLSIIIIGILILKNSIKRN